MDKKIKDLVKKYQDKIEYFDYKEVDVSRVIKDAEKGIFIGMQYLAFALIDICLALAPEGKTEEQFLCVDTALELSEKMYEENPKEGCIALGYAHRIYPAIYEYDIKINKLTENYKAEEEHRRKSLKYFKEGYVVYGDKFCQIEYIKDARNGFFEEYDWEEAIDMLVEMVHQEGCPIGAYRVYAEELIMGIRIKKDVNKANEYFDKAASLGDTIAPVAKRVMNRKWAFAYAKTWPRKNAANNIDGKKSTQTGEGCYIATCVYGSYDCPQVWVLRRYRDFYLRNHWWGRFFIKIYYKISPFLVKKYGHISLFRSFFHAFLDRKIKFLSRKGYINSSYRGN